ncbi:dihydrolipoyl dehydrogenase [Bacteroidia bacterium]|nr:dihydrolipoyl dehydrogenase [Bacteroidia bacterium]GHT80396.1 dihydrolipoyl dehydrogenase [Bacteroidia bacterium]
MNFQIYDIAIIGAGPGGYEAAVRASQLGLSVAIIEKEALGGTCLNRGCIPTKTLLKSANVLRTLQDANSFGIAVAPPQVDLAKVMARSREVVATLRNGIDFLLKKHNVTQIFGTGALVSPTSLRVQKADGITESIEAKHIIIATGARPRSIPAFPIDEERIISSNKALNLNELPASMLIIGSGAIGCEMAYFYACMGVAVTLVEALPNIAPYCDAEVSRQLDRSLRKMGIATLTSAQVLKVERCGTGCRTHLTSKKGEEIITTDLVLSAVGVQANVENIGLEAIGVTVEKGKIKVDGNYCTNVPSVFAVGDVIATPALAHVATAEALRCVERIAGLASSDICYDAVPACIYTSPEVGWAGLTETETTQRGISVAIGKSSYLSSGKANADGARDGFVKLIFDAATLQLLGAHCIGEHVTEMLGELTLAITSHTTAPQLAEHIHAHPTMYEAVGNAAFQRPATN